MARRARHFQVLVRVCGVNGAHSGPVGDHYSVEAPLRGERCFQEVVFAGRGAVDRVIGTHDQPGAGFPDGVLERCEVELAQGLLFNHRVGGEAVSFRLVGEVVLGCRTHAHGLDALNVPGRNGGSEAGILAHALEVAAAQG